MTTYRGPFNPNPNPPSDEASIVIYGYIPSLALGAVALATFSLGLLAHGYWFLRSFKRQRQSRGAGTGTGTGRDGMRWRKGGTGSFHLLFIIGSLMEIGGYASRVISHRRPFVVSAFIAQYFLIVVAPVLFSAGIYISLSLAASAYAAEYTQDQNGKNSILIIKAKSVLAFFITADVITTIIQIAGAGLIGSSESKAVRREKSSITPEQANNILLAGLSCQCFSFLCFLVVLILAIRRISKHTSAIDTGSTSSYNNIDISLVHRLRTLLYITLITSLLILLRTTFRLAETAQGFFGFASTHESLFGTLEYTPVILTVGIWAIAPPARYLQLSTSELS